jgi:hypothetical protein
MNRSFSLVFLNLKVAKTMLRPPALILIPQPIGPVANPNCYLKRTISH